MRRSAVGLRSKLDNKFIFLLLAQYSPFAVQLATGPILARSLGPVDRGYLGVALTLVAVIPITAAMGMPAAARRLAAEGVDSESAGYAASRYNPWVLLITLTLTVVSVQVWFSSMSISESAAIFALLLLSFFGAVRATILALAVGDGRTDLVARYQMSGAAVSGIGIVGLAAWGQLSIVTVCLIYILSQLAQFVIIGGARSIKLKSRKFAPDVYRGALKADLRYALKALPGQFGDVMLLRVDQLLCALILGAYATGLYTVAFSYAFVVFPFVHTLSLKVAAGKSRSRLVADSVRDPLLVLSVGLVFGLVWSVGAFLAVPLLFGSAYQSSAPIAGILTFGVVLFASSTVNVQAAITMGRAHAMSVVSIFVLLIEIGLIVTVAGYESLELIALVGVLASATYFFLSMFVRQSRQTESHLTDSKGVYKMKIILRNISSAGVLVAFLLVSCFFGATVAMSTMNNSFTVAAIYAGISVLVLLVGFPLLKSGVARNNVAVYFLPVFIVYNMGSLFFARTETSSFQAVLVVIGAGSFVAGSLVYSSVADVPITKARPDVRFSRYAAVFLLGSVVAVGLLAVNGVPVLSGDVLTARLGAISNGYAGTVMVVALQSVLIVGISRVVDLGRAVRRDGLFWLGVLSIAILYLFGNRGLYIFPLVSVVSYLLIRRPKAVWVTIPGALLGLTLVSWIGFTRGLEAYGSSYLSTLRRQGVSEQFYIFGPVIEYFKGTSEAVDAVIRTFPDSVPHPWGAVFFSPLLTPLPGKQESAGVFLKESIGLDFSGFGLASGSIGGFYMDFGLAGVFGGFFALAIIAQLIRRRAVESARWTLVLAYYIGHLWAMNYSHPFPYLATVVIPVVILFLTSPLKTVNDPIRDSRAWIDGTEGRWSRSATFPAKS